MTIPEEIRSLIATGPLAHLITLNADGSPQVSVVWVGIDGDARINVAQLIDAARSAGVNRIGLMTAQITVK